MKPTLLVIAMAAGLSWTTIAAFAADTATIYQTGTRGAAGVNQVGNSGENAATINQGPGDANLAFVDQRDMAVNAGDQGATATISQAGNNNSANVNMFRDGPGQVNAALAQNGDGHTAFATINDSAGATTTIDQSGSGNAASTGQLSVQDASILVVQESAGNSAFVSQHDGASLSANVLMTGSDNVAVLDQSGVMVAASTSQSGNGNYLSITQVGTGPLDSASIVQATNINAATITQVGGGFTASIVQDTGDNNSASINQHF